MKKKIIKRGLLLLFVVFVLINVVAYFHAYKFTHFDPEATVKTKDGYRLSLGQKIKTLFLGISNPRPANYVLPKRTFETVRLKSNKEIECWLIKTNSTKGTVILFHGYGGQKSSMLDKAEVFLNLGYNTLLVDFMGSGGSEGNQSTIGFYEAEEVKITCEYVRQLGENNIFLFGTSMGAVSIMKALNDSKINVNGVILECPFGTMLETVQARFKIMKMPDFPMARLLVFWGGIQNDFNAFAHNPVEYAKSIECPVLLLYGEQDEKVSGKEINDIFSNIKGRKKLSIYPLAGHENYLTKYRKEWTEDVRIFLDVKK